MEDPFCKSTNIKSPSLNSALTVYPSLGEKAPAPLYLKSGKKYVSCLPSPDNGAMDVSEGEKEIIGHSSVDNVPLVPSFGQKR